MIDPGTGVVIASSITSVVAKITHPEGPFWNIKKVGARELPDTWPTETPPHALQQ